MICVFPIWKLDSLGITDPLETKTKLEFKKRQNHFSKPKGDFSGRYGVIQLIPGKDGNVRVARVKTETGELVRPVQRLYNLELQEPEINLPKDLTDSVIRSGEAEK
ncbi:hypothetical protein TNIN_166871 [Trichonephila inaurata madagascariensis]|uniref:DUF5641 domain-containing protein n=1 Tax=Trichonephila inaurata madagascariensis TaxID=2747483 RepID=A0A8X7C7T8_9ARAC|nr:hypothetical protein TNIN_166871 [Trichonephila inaurata madagascariensis]